jgi:RNA polymerase sigma-70 factor (ECF subfamily)
VTAPRAAGATSLEEIYRRHHGTVFRLALRYGRGDLGFAEDVTHDVFLDLIKALPGLDELDQLSGWLYRATTNRCLKRLRRERFLTRPSVRWLLEHVAGKPRPPEVVAMARDDLRHAFDALSALPPKERVIFCMVHLDDQSQEEIGRILGHSKGYVSKLLHRAVSRLRAAGWDVTDA